jgi:hypothetical protein
MSLTRKHFKAIAEILGSYKANEEMIEAFAEYFYSENHKFDDTRFKDYVRGMIEIGKGIDRNSLMKGGHN